MTYNLKLIIDYVNGNDIEGHSIDELENNPKFMISVIMYSNDKKFYNLCSEDVKHNYEFVDFLINKYKNDHNFIDKVVNNFLKDNDNTVEKVSIIIKMCNIFENTNNFNLFVKYKVIILAKLLVDMVNIENYKIENPNDDEIGLGFMIYFDSYNPNVEVLNFCAKFFINYIFDKLNVNLEYELHHKYENPNDIYNDGINNFMIDFLRKYDEYLADYASIHKEVLNEFQERINDIQRRWNKYPELEEKNKYLLMFSRVHEYMEKHEDETIIGEDMFIYYIGKELGISDKLAAYSDDKVIYDKLFNKIDIDNDFINITSVNSKEKTFYNNIKKIMLETLFDQYEDEQTKGKIIEFKQRKKTK